MELDTFATRRASNANNAAFTSRTGGKTMIRKLFTRSLPVTAILAVSALMPLSGAAHAQSIHGHHATAMHAQVDPYNSPHCDYGNVASNFDGAAVCTDRRFYHRGQLMLLCYDVPEPGTDVEWSLTYPNGYTRVLGAGMDDGTGDCFEGRAGSRGWRTLTLDYSTPDDGGNGGVIIGATGGSYDSTVSVHYFVR